MALNTTLKFVKPNKIGRNFRRFASALAEFNTRPEAPINLENVEPKPLTLVGGRHTVTLLPGVGIGPELSRYVKEIFKFIGAPVDFEEIEIGPNRHPSEDLNYAITSVYRNGVALESNLDAGEPYSDCHSPNEQLRVSKNNATLRKELDLFANAVHCTSYSDLPQRHANIDVLVVRQNTEGEYAMLEHEAVNGIVESMKVVSRANVERVIRYAFDCALLKKRKKVTTIHKANIMKLSDGFFLDVSREIAQDYPTIIHDDMIVDAACMRLIATPQHFDVILTTNLYGSIVSNILCGMVGGPGLISGKNVGARCVTFEPATRGTGFDIAGKNLANPIAMLNAAANMLEHLEHNKHAEYIRRGIIGSIRDGVHTRDLGGSASSREVIDSIKRHVEIAARNN